MVLEPIFRPKKTSQTSMIAPEANVFHINPGIIALLPMDFVQRILDVGVMHPDKVHMSKQIVFGIK